MAQPRSGRPHKLTEWDHWVLKHVTLTTEFQNGSGSNISTRTVRLELWPWVSMAEQPHTSLRSPCAMPWFGEGPFQCHSLGKAFFCFSITMPYGARSIQKWFIEIIVEELDWCAHSSDLNPIGHLWDELERRLRARPNRSKSVPNLTNALVAEWKQVPAAMFQHLEEGSPRRGEAVVAKGGQLHINAHDFGMRGSMSRCPH
jgi:hypothetical protein